MKQMLLGGLGLFILCQCVHICIWRVRIPSAYPLWLLGVFVILPTVSLTAGLSWLFIGNSPLLTGELLTTVLGAYLLHGALAGVYAIAYPGVIHFSPTVEIAKNLAKSMPHGRLASELQLPLFTPDNMLDLRVENLLKARLITSQGGRLTTTAKGARIAWAFVLFRRLLGLPEMGGG